MWTRRAPQRGRHGSVGRAVLRLLVAGMLFFLVSPVLPFPSGQDGVTLAATTFLSGVVTSKTGSGIRINDSTYDLDPNVTVKDDEGQVMSVEDVVPGSVVKFHLKRGKIDKIIVILPR